MASERDNSLVNRAIAVLRQALAGTEYEGLVYLVGGVLRDRELKVPHGADLDLVLEADAVELAKRLFHAGVSTHYPVLYPRFGTAMVHLDLGDCGVDVELVTARTESYNPDSRKPQVKTGTLKEDIYRRDFTINTLAENLFTSELLDITGRAFEDLNAGIIRTPVEPRDTFFDDPLRMLRAVRFAARFEFAIEEGTWCAVQAEAARLKPPTIAYERIRDEFVKIAMLPGRRFRAGMELLLESGLLEQFIPDMLPMVGCTQGNWHPYDVWNHTLKALEALPDSAPLEARLALLWHDIGKPATRSLVQAEGQPDNVRFFGHPALGADMTRSIMNRLKFPNEEIGRVAALVSMHMRLGDYRPEWDDPAVKRMIRDTHEVLDSLFIVTACDRSAVNIPDEYLTDLAVLRKRIDSLLSAVSIESPLDGKEIMALLGVAPGPHLKRAKDFLTDAVIDGRLAADDRAAAGEMLKQWWTSSAGD